MSFAQAATFLLVLFSLVLAVRQVLFVLSRALGKITARLLCRSCKTFGGEPAGVARGGGRGSEACECMCEKAFESTIYVTRV